MILQSHPWACFRIKPYFKKIHAPQCSLQPYLQQPRYGSNLMPIGRGTDKDDAVHIYNEILLSHKKNKTMPLSVTWMYLAL